MTPRRVRKSLQNGPREATETERESSDLFCSFFAPLGRLLGRSWRAPCASWGRLGVSWAVPGASWGAPGGHFGLPEASFWSFLAFFFGCRRKSTKTLKFDDSCSENQGFGTPRGSRIEPKWLQNRSRGPLGGLWKALGRLLSRPKWSSVVLGRLLGCPKWSWLRGGFGTQRNSAELSANQRKSAAKQLLPRLNTIVRATVSSRSAYL